MAKIVEMPKLSPTMQEGLLSIWHKKEGDAIETDDLLAEVETDKATMEFRSFDRGVLLKILIPAGTEVKLGQPVAILGSVGESIDALIASIPEPKKAVQQASPSPQEPAPAPLAAIPQERQVTLSPAWNGSVLERTEQLAQPSQDADRRAIASPYIRKVARDRGIAIEQVRGSGPHGRIVETDLQSTQTHSALSIPSPQIRPLSPMRKTIARRLSESKSTIPHFYLTIDVNATALARVRSECIATTLEKKDSAIKISVNDLIVKACALALVRVPECNAQFSPEAILVHPRIDISIAVAVPDGLVTPVVRHADKKSLSTLAEEIRALAEKARNKKLIPEEMQNGTFSISNLGMFGIDAFSAVINPPEAAILAVGRMRDEPVVHDGQITLGKRMTLTLSCDHRVIDGAVGARFLEQLRFFLENPLQILVG